MDGDGVDGIGNRGKGGGKRRGDENVPGTPAVAEVDDEQPDHYYGRPPCGFVSCPLMLVFAEDDGDGDMADEHPRRAGQHDRLAA